MFTRVTFFILMTLYIDLRAAPLFDYAVATPFRTYPLAGGLAAQGGVDFLLWGEKAQNLAGYGYTRLGSMVASSGRTHGYDVSLQFFPISFLGVEVGHAESVRFANAFYVDCSIAQCQGSLSRNYIRGSFVFGVPELFGSIAIKTTTISPSQSEIDFVDEYSNLVGRSGGDRLVTKEFVMGHKFNDQWTAVALLNEESMVEKGSASRLTGIATRYKMSPWVFGLGAGLYQSSSASLGLSIFGGIKWIGAPSLALD